MSVSERPYVPSGHRTFAISYGNMAVMTVGAVEVQNCMFSTELVDNDAGRTTPEAFNGTEEIEVDKTESMIH